MKVKRLLALMLALTLAVAVFAMPAAAATTVPCPSCGAAALYSTNATGYSSYQRYDYCQFYGSVHNHKITNYYGSFSCQHCGYTSSSATTNLCVATGNYI